MKFKIRLWQSLRKRSHHSSKSLCKISQAPTNHNFKLRVPLIGMQMRRSAILTSRLRTFKMRFLLKGLPTKQPLMFWSLTQNSARNKSLTFSICKPWYRIIWYFTRKIFVRSTKLIPIKKDSMRNSMKRKSAS